MNQNSFIVKYFIGTEHKYCEQYIFLFVKCIRMSHRGNIYLEIFWKQKYLKLLYCSFLSS